MTTYSQDRAHERLKAALWEQPFGSAERLDAVEAAIDGGVPMEEIESILDGEENHERLSRVRR